MRACVYFSQSRACETRALSPQRERGLARGVASTKLPNKLYRDFQLSSLDIGYRLAYYPSDVIEPFLRVDKLRAADPRQTGLENLHNDTDSSNLPNTPPGLISKAAFGIGVERASTLVAWFVPRSFRWEIETSRLLPKISYICYRRS